MNILCLIHTIFLCITFPATTKVHILSESLQTSLDNSYDTTVPGIDERFPLYPDTNITEMFQIYQIYQYSKQIKTLEDRSLSLDTRAEKATQILHLDKISKMNILAGGLMDEWLMEC
jgi:hypothetical protein